MTATAILPTSAVIVAPHELSADPELVRGHDRPLLDHMTPVVCRQSVALDLSAVRRIDAAGIAALVQLYRTARDAGNSFTLLNVAPRIAQILRVVGLDRVLFSNSEVSQNEALPAHGGPRFRRSAA